MLHIGFLTVVLSSMSYVIDEPNLIDLLKTTQNNNKNSLISFKDNASVIQGSIESFHYLDNGRVNIKQNILIILIKLRHIIFQQVELIGAATGAGGRMRDNVCVGVGGNLIAGTAGYCVGDVDQEYK